MEIKKKPAVAGFFVAEKEGRLAAKIRLLLKQEAIAGTLNRGTATTTTSSYFKTMPPLWVTACCCLGG